jgi:hypothetical protein
MTDHDQLMKALIKTFFKEYLDLFFPDLARRLYLDSPQFPVEFLDKEHFTDIPKGKKRTVDILARVWTRDEMFETILIHSEHQEDDRQDPDEEAMPFLDRMFCYSLLLQLRRFPEHVVPIVLWFVPDKGGIGVATYDHRAMGAGMQLTYYRICVPDLSAEEYLDKGNPLAYGLAARMKRGKLSKVELSLACRSRILRSKITEVKKVILLDMVETYVKLSKKEETEMQAILENQPEYADIKEEDLTYFGRIEYRAHKEARKEDLLDILAARGFSVPEEVRARILATQDLGQLKQWITRAVGISSLAELFA